RARRLTALLISLPKPLSLISERSSATICRSSQVAPSPATCRSRLTAEGVRILSPSPPWLRSCLPTLDDVLRPSNDRHRFARQGPIGAGPPAGEHGSGHKPRDP